MWIRVGVLCWLALVGVSGDARAEAYRFQDVQRLVAVGDAHGDYEHFSRLLVEAGVVDTKLQWAAGKTHLVDLGDMLDRGPESRKIMDLLMRLQGQARRSGGQVHVLMGNHELMNLVGDLRYVSRQEYRSYQDMEDQGQREAAREYYDSLPDEAHSHTFDEVYPPGFFGHRRAFSADGVYGKWLRSLPFMIVINDTVFAHGGLPPLVAERGLEGSNRFLANSLSRYEQLWGRISRDINVILPPTYRQRPRLAGASLAPGVEQFRQMSWNPLFTPQGPVWSRQDSVCLPVAVEQDLGKALERLGATRLVVGHTVTFNHRISSRFDGRVIMIDTGMLAGSYPGGVASALVIDKAVASATYLGQGAGHAIAPLPRHVGERPGRMGDDELEGFLETADIVAIEELGSGVTRPKRLTLERDGVRVRALFKDVSHDEKYMGNTVVEFADHWKNEVAAYRLDRLLDLEVVPVTVERVVEGRRGSLQFWVQELINWREVTEQNLEPGNWCAMRPQYQVLRVFDSLIYNLDRTQENLDFDREDWKLVLIDHSRSFSAKPRILKKFQDQYLVVTPDMARRLKSLQIKPLLRVMYPYLSPAQIRGLLKRRNILLKDYLERIPASGPTPAPVTTPVG